MSSSLNRVSLIFLAICDIGSVLWRPGRNDWPDGLYYSGEAPHSLLPLGGIANIRITSDTQSGMACPLFNLYIIPYKLYLVSASASKDSDHIMFYNVL